VPELPCEQSSPGDPGTVVGGPFPFPVPFPFPLPESARAADTPMPAISRPTIATTFAAFSVHPVMPVLSSPWMGLATGRPWPHKPGKRSPVAHIGKSQRQGRATKVLM
jgi:hypothetical protein